jgi:hypothetical protein
MLWNIAGVPPWSAANSPAGGSAVDFSATSGYFDVPIFTTNYTVQSGSDVTFSWWHWYDDANAQSSVFFNGNQTGSVYAQCHCPYNNAMYWDYPAWNAPNGRISASISGTANKWHHFCVVGGISYRSIWMDGVMLASNSLTASGFGTQDYWMSIGAWPSVKTAYGKIQNFAGWTRALTPTEILSLYREPYRGVKSAMPSLSLMKYLHGNPSASISRKRFFVV